MRGSQMRPSFPAALSCAAACALFVTAGVAFQAAPQAPPPAGSQSSAPAAPTAPAQFPPLGTGVSPEETRHAPGRGRPARRPRVTALKVKYRSGAMADRVADVEVYLDAVRRPLKYDERLYAPDAAARRSPTRCRRSRPAPNARSSWLDGSDPVDDRRAACAGSIRGSTARRSHTSSRCPTNYDAAAKRQYRLDLFMHGRDDTVLEQQFMTKSTTGYTSKPLGAGRRSLHAAAVRPLHQREPVRRRDRRSRGHRVGREGLPDRPRTASSWPASRWAAPSAWSFIVHFADRWAAGAPGAGFTETEVFLRGALRAPAAERRAADALAHVRLDRLRDEHVQRAGRRVLRRHRRPEAGRRCDGGGDARRRADARARHRPEHRSRLRARRAAAGAGSAGSTVAAGPERRVPKEIRFTTWMLRYNKMFWLTVDAMGQHWERARVNATHRRRTPSGSRPRTSRRCTSRSRRAWRRSPPGAKPTLTIDGDVASRCRPWRATAL